MKVSVKSILEKLLNRNAIVTLLCCNKLSSSPPKKKSSTVSATVCYSALVHHIILSDKTTTVYWLIIQCRYNSDLWYPIIRITSCTYYYVCNFSLEGEKYENVFVVISYTYNRSDCK